MTNRLRTVNTAYAEIKAKDPQTAVTKNAIRTIVIAGKIPSLQFGNKVVFNLDDLEDYLFQFGNPGNSKKEGCSL